MTDTKHTAAQPLDLDKLEALAQELRNLPGFGPDHFEPLSKLANGTIALIAQARAALPAQALDDAHLKQLVLDVSNASYFCGTDPERDGPAYAGKLEKAASAEAALIQYVQTIVCAAQAHRAARLDTTASASAVAATPAEPTRDELASQVTYLQNLLDSMLSEFDKLPVYSGGYYVRRDASRALFEQRVSYCGIGSKVCNNCGQLDCKRLVCRAAHPVQAGEAVDERALFEAKVRELSNGEPDFNSAAAMWAWAMWQARATLSPVAAQQAAAMQHNTVECDSALRAEPASQRDADERAFFEHWDKANSDYGYGETHIIAYKAAQAAWNAASRCRAEGGNTSDKESSNPAAKAPAAQAAAAINYQPTAEYQAWFTNNRNKLRNHSIFTKGAVIWNAAKAALAVPAQALRQVGNPDHAARAWMEKHGYGNQSFGYALVDLQSRIEAKDDELRKFVSQQAAAVAAPSVDTPELRRLVNGYRYACEGVQGHAVPQWRALVAYVASLAAPAAAATTSEDARHVKECLVLLSRKNVGGSWMRSDAEIVRQALEAMRATQQEGGK